MICHQTKPFSILFLRTSIYPTCKPLARWDIRSIFKQSKADCHQGAIDNTSTLQINIFCLLSILNEVFSEETSCDWVRGCVGLNWSSQHLLWGRSSNARDAFLQLQGAIDNTSTLQINIFCLLSILNEVFSEETSCDWVRGCVGLNWSSQHLLWGRSSNARDAFLQLHSSLMMAINPRRGSIHSLTGLIFHYARCLANLRIRLLWWGSQFSHWPLDYMAGSNRLHGTSITDWLILMTCKPN